VYGFNSIPLFAFGLPSSANDDAVQLKPGLLAAMKPQAVETAAIQWKEQQLSWLALRKLLPD
jgi:hypothetical protein